MNKLTSKLGFWSATLITVLNVVSSVARLISFQTLSMALGFLVAILFVVLMTSVHYYAPDDKKILTLLGVAFSILCASLLGINYYMQLTVVRWNSLPLLAISNPHSIMWAIEVLGYGFMGLATLFPALIFSKRKLELGIRWLFIANAILGIGGVIGLVVIDNPMNLFAGLLVWDVVFPLMTLLLSVFFKHKL